MNAIERIKMVKAMEYICRNLNDENHVDCWLVSGVADGDIEYGDLSVRPDDADDLDYYIDRDDVFGDIMDTFLHVMHRAYRGGGLYADGVLSKPKDE